MTTKPGEMPSTMKQGCPVHEVCLMTGGVTPSLHYLPTCPMQWSVSSCSRVSTTASVNISCLTRKIFAAKVCLEEMVTNCNPLDQYGPQFAHRILAMATQNEALLYSIMSAAMMFNRASRNLESASATELYVTTKAVQRLSERMADAQVAIQESNIWAVFTLGTLGAVSQVRTGKLPQQSFLKELQSLHVVGRLQINLVHVQGLFQLMSMIGGPSKLKTPGMASMFSL